MAIILLKVWLAISTFNVVAFFTLMDKEDGWINNILIILASCAPLFQIPIAIINIVILYKGRE